MESKVKEWDEFYTEWNKQDYLRHIKAQKGFANRLMRFTPDKGRVLDVGFGSGQISIYFAQKGYRATGFDSNLKQSVRAERLAEIIGVDVSFFNIDILKFSEYEASIKLFDVSFSQGLLEHFSNANIENIINIQLRLASTVGFSVPLEAFGHQSRGDERLMEWDWWLGFVKDYKILYEEIYAKDTHGMVIFREKA